MAQGGEAFLLGKGDTPQLLELGLANRHGLIAGATGTGKTVSLQVLAEGFAAHGVPVFMADIKGDLSGISQSGAADPKLAERARTVGLTDYQPRAFPAVFWDLFGEQGHPVRTTVFEMGPLLLARLLGLNETQEGVLAVAFEVADDQGLLLLDLKDLRALMSFVAEHADEFSTKYGRVSTASISAIQRQLLTLEQQGGEHFFGEPALDIQELMRTDLSGQGTINVLAADRLMAAPKLYATFLLWLLSELFEDLPEVGDPPKPRLVFFFDEAHLLFEEAPKALLDKIEQVVRLIRSKGSAYTSSRRTRWTSRTTCSASSATGSSTRCAHSRRAISGRCGPPRIPSASIPSSTSPRRSPSSGSARRWSRRCTTRACRGSSSAP